jgi:hypothetical protein
VQKPTGTVRVHNSTQAAPICGVQIGPSRTPKLYEQRIEPGKEADFQTTNSGNQQPVKIKLCGQATHMTQNVEFSQGSNHLVVLFDGTDAPDLQTPAGYARYDLRNSHDTSQLVNLAKWQTEKGVKKDWVYFSLVNRCKRRVDYKYEPSTKASQGIDAEPAGGYRFWTDQSYKEISEHAPLGLTIWLKDAKGDWKEGPKVEAGTSKRLEIAQDCKTVAERTDDKHYHGCYEWAYTTACPKQSKVSAQPTGCPEGAPSVEGDMSKPCEFKTEKGTCTIQFAQATYGCDRR